MDVVKYLRVNTLKCKNGQKFQANVRGLRVVYYFCNFSNVLQGWPLFKVCC